MPFGLFFAWRYRYYGYPFPNTYYIKAAGSSASATRWGLPYLLDFARDNKLYALLALVPLFWPRSCWNRAMERRSGASPGSSRAAATNEPERRGGASPSSRAAATNEPERVPVRPRFFWSYLALLTVPFLGYVVAVGGDFMAMGRFFVPVLPVIALFAAEALRETFERPRLIAPDSWRLSRWLPATTLLVSLALWNSVGLHRESAKPAYRRWGLDTMAYLDRFAADRVVIGRWMREHLPPNTYLAVGGAGAIVYASRLKALDTFGLNDRYIAHHTPPVGDCPGHTKSAPEDYLRRERPDLMCHQAHHQDVPYRPSPAEEQQWRSRGYHWVCLAPPGLRPAYYCCLKRLDRALGPFGIEVGS